MNPVALGAVLLTLISGAAGESGSKLWDGVVALVRSPFARRGAQAAVVHPLRSGALELAALERAAQDRDVAVRLAETLIARAVADAGFARDLEGWWDQARGAVGGDVTNTISGGTQHGPVLMRRDFSAIEEAITAHRDAAAIFRETGDWQSEGTALNSLGNALGEVGRFEEAITACQVAAATFWKSRDRPGRGRALNSLGNALGEVGRFEEAITAYQDAAGIFRETGDRHSEGCTLGNLGNALGDVGRFEEAITAHQGAAAIFRETGDRPSEGSVLNSLGDALREVGRFEEAFAAYQDAAALLP